MTIQLYLCVCENFGWCIPFPERGLSLGIFPAGNLMHPGCTHPGCFPRVNCFSKCLSKLLTWYIFKISPVICYYHCNNVFSITKPHQTESSKELCSNFCYFNSLGVHCGFKLSDCTFFLCWYLNPLILSKVQWSCISLSECNVVSLLVEHWCYQLNRSHCSGGTRCTLWFRRLDMETTIAFKLWIFLLSLIQVPESFPDAVVQRGYIFSD